MSKLPIDAKEQQESLLEQPNRKTFCKNIPRKIASTAIGIGTGLAMTPVFNYEVRTLEKYGVNIHNNIYTSSAFTINTLLTYSVLSGISVYHLLKNSQQYTDKVIPKLQKATLNLAKGAALCSVVLPLSQLWEVELHNRHFSNSHGFDEFLAWATFTSLPLTIYRSLESFNQIKASNKEVALDNLGSNLFVYGSVISSAAGRFIAYTAAGYSLCKMLTAKGELALAVGITIGGVLGSGVVAAAEYQSIKSLFAKQQYPISCKELMISVFSAIEGVWCTLPLISTGIRAMDDWSPLTKGLLFVPLLISHSILEATTIYKNIELPKYSSGSYTADSFYTAFKFLNERLKDSFAPEGTQEKQALYNLYDNQPWGFYLLTATAMGNFESTYQLAECFHHGTHGLQQNTQMANWLIITASLRNHPDLSDVNKLASDVYSHLQATKRKIGAHRLTTSEIKSLVKDFNKGTTSKSGDNSILSYFNHTDPEEDFSPNPTAPLTLDQSVQNNAANLFAERLFDDWLDSFHQKLSGESTDALGINSTSYCTIL